MADDIPELDFGVDVQNSELSSVIEPSIAEMPILVEKRKPRTNSRWVRPKSHVYEYNYDYGSNYYKNMVDYLNQRSRGFQPEIPKPQTWAERALNSYTEKRQVLARTKTNQDLELLHKIRYNVNTYAAHTKTYARKFSSVLA